MDFLNADGKINLDDVSAIFVPNLIGNIANWNEIYNFAKENNLKVIEDSADTIGYSYDSYLSNWSDNLVNINFFVFSIF